MVLDNIEHGPWRHPDPQAVKDEQNVRKQTLLTGVLDDAYAGYVCVDNSTSRQLHYKACCSTVQSASIVQQSK